MILLQPYYRNITSSLVKIPKIYWLDIGLLRMLCGFRETEYGAIYETLVAAEFYKWIKTMQRPVELYFYRTRSGLEIDLLLQTPHEVIGVEVKGRESVSLADCRAMKEVAAGLGSEWLGGMVVYRGAEIRKCLPVYHPAFYPGKHFNPLNYKIWVNLCNLWAIFKKTSKNVERLGIPPIFSLS